MSSEHEFAVAAIGEDRPGIVAAVSEALLAAGMGIEDSSMTILGGQFAMLLIVRGGADSGAVEAVLAPVALEQELVVQVVPTAGQAAEGNAGTDEEWVIAAYGPDRPGLVASLARVLADARANVTDFGSRVSGGGTFSMWFNVTIPSAVDVEALRQRLATAGGDVSLDVNLEQVDSSAL
jgi:glycine cleavage system transcriptional repressor